MVAAVGARLPERVAGLVLANTAVALPRIPRGTAFHRFARTPVVSDLAFRLLRFPQNILHRVQGRAIRARSAATSSAPTRGPCGAGATGSLPSPWHGWCDGPEHPSMPALRRGEEWARSFQGPVALV